MSEERRGVNKGGGERRREKGVNEEGKREVNEEGGRVKEAERRGKRTYNG
jgi:hypothetical protein